MFSSQTVLWRFAAAFALTFFLAACGGSDAGPHALSVTGAQAPSTVVLKTPVLSFNDTGLNVTDGVTKNGLWAVESAGIDWEFSLDQGVNWTRGSGASFEVKEDGAKMIWVRARDNAGNTSEIVRVNCVLDTTPPRCCGHRGSNRGRDQHLQIVGH